MQRRTGAGGRRFRLGEEHTAGLAGLLWRPTRGRVFFMGRDVSEDSSPYRNRLRRRHVGFIFQNYHLFERMPAWESIALPLRIRGHRAGAPRGTGRRLRLGRWISTAGLTPAPNRSGRGAAAGRRRPGLAAEPDLVIADEPLQHQPPVGGQGSSPCLSTRVPQEGPPGGQSRPAIQGPADRRLELDSALPARRRWNNSDPPSSFRSFSPRSGYLLLTAGRPAVWFDHPDPASGQEEALVPKD